MEIGKIGASIGKEIIAWTRTSGKSVLATRPVKVNIKGLKYAPELKADIFNSSRTIGKIKDISDMEYDLILNKIRKINWIIPCSTNGKLSSFRNEFLPLLQYNKEYYPNIPHKMEGIIPYVGHENGFYKQINEYLSGRTLSGKYHLPDKDIEDFINCCKYSLKHVDSEFGAYNGYVYRAGYFSGQGEQFYSTSLSPDLNDFFRRNIQLNVIRAKNGHKIYKFQNKYHIKPNDFEAEKEILLSPGQLYREIAMNERDFTEAEKLAKIYHERYPDMKITDIISKIKFWEAV